MPQRVHWGMPPPISSRNARRWWLGVALSGCILGSSCASPEKDSAELERFDPAACEGRRDLDALRVVADDVTLFSSGPVCADRPPVMVLVENTDDAPVTLRALGFEARQDVADGDSVATASGFEATLRSGPVIPPGEVAHIELTYVADEDVMQASAELVVDTDRGCQAFYLHGVSVTEGGLIDSPFAVDFGVLAPGEHGEPKDVVFYFSAVTDDAADVRLGTGQAQPSEVFEVLEEIPPTTLVSCQPYVTRVRAHAPEEEGVIEGYVGFETLAAGFVGAGVVRLRLLVRQPD